MFSKHRWVASLVYLLALIATLVVALTVRLGRLLATSSAPVVVDLRQLWQMHFCYVLSAGVRPIALVVATDI